MYDSSSTQKHTRFRFDKSSLLKENEAKYTQNQCIADMRSSWMRQIITEIFGKSI